MSKYARSTKARSKHPVADVATPCDVILSKPIGDRFQSLYSARSVLELRHSDLGSWRIVAYELVENVGTLYNIAKHGRTPSASLVKKLNHVYGCHIHINQKMIVVPCQKCGEMPRANHRCKNQPSKPRRKYDLSYAEIRRRIEAAPWSQEIKRELRALLGV